MTPRWRYGAAAALVLAAALVYVLLQAPDYDEPAYFEDVARLQQIRQLDSQWELDVMKARLGMLHGYDALVQPLQDMQRLPRQLHPCPGNAALAASVAAFLQELDAKAALVESFKSGNALSRNSLAYLVTLADQADDAAQDMPLRNSAAWQVRDTLLETLEYIEHDSSEQLADVERQLDKLSAAQRSMDGTMQRIAEDFTMHVRIMLREHGEINRMLEMIADAPTGVRLAQINALLSAELAQASSRVRQHRLYLLALSTALSGLLLYAAVRLLHSHALINKYNARLRQANDTLEAAVLFRTEELSLANSRLQGEIAERKQLQSRMVQTEKLAAIGQLAAGVAHEINNPLGFLSSNFGVLQEYLGSMFEMLAIYESAEAGLAAPASDTVRCARERMQLALLREDIPVLIAESTDGMERVGKIVQSLKEFSRADTEQEWEWADLHRGIESTMTIIAKDLRKAADVVREFGALPPVECVPSQLNQVVMNLLINAVHAVEQERGRIVIRTGCTGGEVWLEVQDSGCGIPADVLPRIFDPFFTTKAVGKGTGLGLSLSYGIVQRHQGRIDVATAPGRGATFRVTLPVRQRIAAPCLSLAEDQ